MVKKRMTYNDYTPIEDIPNGHMDRLYFLLDESAANLERSKQALEDAGIDTSYTVKDALNLFFDTHDELQAIDDATLRNEFHDTMHIVALAHYTGPHAEALTGVVEQTLLREPYNGDIDAKLAKAREPGAPPIRGFIISTRHFNPEGQQDFSAPAPIASLQSALELGYHRLDLTRGKAPREEIISEDEMIAAYERAEEINDFFHSMMGERAPYQLSQKELIELPLALFGVQKTGASNELTFEDIPEEKKQTAIAKLGNENTILHPVQSARIVYELRTIGMETILSNLETSEPDLSLG